MVAAGVFGRAPPPGVERPPVASSCAALSLSPTLGVVRTPLALRAFVQPKGLHARFLRPGGAKKSFTYQRKADRPASPPRKPRANQGRAPLAAATIAHELATGGRSGRWGRSKPEYPCGDHSRSVLPRTWQTPNISLYRYVCVQLSRTRRRSPKINVPSCRSWRALRRRRAAAGCGGLRQAAARRH